MVVVAVVGTEPWWRSQRRTVGQVRGSDLEVLVLLVEVVVVVVVVVVVL